MRILFQFMIPVAAFSLLALAIGVPWLVVVLLASLIGAGIGWHLESHRIAEKTRDTVMASVMDAQNNLLNNLVYFRLSAERSEALGPEELGHMDNAIRTTQHRLIEIAESDLRKTRDLGGVEVLCRPRSLAVAKAAV